MQPLEKLWHTFYIANPEMRREGRWKARLTKFIEYYYHHLLMTNEATPEGWLSIFRKLPDMENLRREDQKYRADRSGQFVFMQKELKEMLF